ncbi:MAG: hypothetical protein GWN84_13030 [Gammaproteobacteria bacterium]|nr:hypothetical protein [Gammaproteobacteria bacterium]NIR58145.1 hypothetical protein [Gammaproteobacteria bacterium]NIR88141.1 hypothetical protein [Gammaproteobacteria bacterium]
MDVIRNDDAVNERANDLAAKDLNGLKLALVTLHPAGAPTEARLELYFHNDRHVADILAEIAGDPSKAGVLFVVLGGHRVPAGPGSGQVKVTAVAGLGPDSLLLTVAPIGDYSTYTLELTYSPDRVDPYFAQIDFKFRPGCFTNDCAPLWEPAPAPRTAPVIDYLAKDYDSFRHTLMTAMMQRVPGWRSTSEADFDQVLIDLFAAAGDELSDYQDRVMAEAYLATARKRVSLARHARLMDYHIHQGNQASTWLALTVDSAAAPFTLGEELLVWSGQDPPLPDAAFFASREKRLAALDKQLLDPSLNALRLHTWSDAQPALRAGSTSADVVPDVPGGAQPEADRVRDLIQAGTLRYLLVQEHINPLTGRVPGRDPRKRQLLRLKSGPDAAQTIHDPLEDVWLVRVQWEHEDRLRFDYSFTTFCPSGKVERVSLFHGNLLKMHHGLPVKTHFHEPGADLPLDSEQEKHRYFERPLRYQEPKGVLCALPFWPLAYLPTPTGGEVAPQSTLHVEVEEPGAATDVWDEVISLVHSDDSEEEGDHFAVETDELQRTRLRFGNGVNGRLPPAGAIVHCEYQIGAGHAGNVGADALVHFQALPIPHAADIVAVWNPFDVTDGRDPEPVEKILRNAPEAYAVRQLRAVTLADYIRRAEEVDGVSRAVARYAWTGSWRTVRVCIDPEGTTELKAELREAVAAHLESVRLIGEDLEIRPPRFVPLDIEVSLCVQPDFWPEDLRFVLEQEFSDGYTPDGRRGFFHPDEWTFGQPLHRSQIEGRVQRVAGVEHIVAISMQRFNEPTPGTPNPAVLEVAFDEIFEVHNDPDHLELGFIDFDLKGGRQ